jgi:HSP20 family molecular chaperone IbpA
MPRSAADLMWAEAVAVLTRAERLRQDFFRPDRQGWEPPVDVLQTAEELVIMAALPGVQSDEVEIVVEDSSLVIVGSRPLPAFLRQARVLRMELPHGRFERRVSIPPGRYDVTRRNLTDGLLVLALRRLP